MPKQTKFVCLRPVLAWLGLNCPASGKSFAVKKSIIIYPFSLVAKCGDKYLTDVVVEENRFLERA
jgi:hypothetical protein